MIAGPSGAAVNIVLRYAGIFHQLYNINAVPINMQTWKTGVYFFAVVDKSDANHGQTLAKALMDLLLAVRTIDKMKYR